MDLFEKIFNVLKEEDADVPEAMGALTFVMTYIMHHGELSFDKTCEVIKYGLELRKDEPRGCDQ